MWLLWASHKNSFVSEALIVIGDVHLSLFALTSLQTLLEIKIIVFYERSSLQSQVFFWNLTDWLDESLLCCCYTITHSRQKLFLVIGDVHLALFALRSLFVETLLEIKIIFFLTEYLVQKAKFLKKKWPIDMMSLYSVVVTHLVHVWSFLCHWRCLPGFICHEILINFVGRKILVFS